MSKTLLLEIGTEEVPAHVMPGILSQLKENAAKAFDALRIGYSGIRTLGTPRRSALIMEGLEERQADLSRESRGPAAGIAFAADGSPTRAAQGFARSQGVRAEELTVRDGYVYAAVHEAGGRTIDLLGETLAGLIDSLSFPNSMHWADLDYKFIRPLRWLVALYGEDVIDFEVASVRAGRTSRGHRFLSEGDFEIAAADDYEAACERNFVVVDQNKRCDMIREQIAGAAAANGGKAEINEELLEEVLYLVEYPTALCGRFDEKYLQLPAEAVITPMRDHQRYFPVLKDGKLLPLFITIRNGGREFLDVVRHGNERVLRARLEDARFFFDEDRKKSLEEHAEKLKAVVFQEGLGSVYDKAQRLGALSAFIADELQVSGRDKADALRAARLAKADLVTGMVTEFTELQGVMGREYALLDGENAAVAQAIDEHYMPRFAGDAQPASTAGRIVSLADKLDNIVATFSRGLIPTGSQDPFALRRQALGIVNMLNEAEYHLSLSRLVGRAMELLGLTEAGVQEKLQAEVAEFMKLRLKNVLAEAGVRYDVVEAVFVSIDDIYEVSLRAAAVNEAVGRDMEKTVQAFVRAGNIARRAEAAAAVDGRLLTEQVEKNLYAAYRTAADRAAGQLAAQDYAGAVASLSALAEPIDAFFDGVMVMDGDERIKNNRLGLLKLVDGLICRIADFSKIVLA